MFSGSFVALVTPFRKGEIDEKAFASLVERHVEAGTDGIIPCGTTGESATLSFDEHQHLIRLAVKLARGRVKVIAGTGSNSTAEAIFLSKSAEKDGADGCLVVTPYYNKPTQKGLIQYYREVASSVSLPIIAYNVPGRTGVNILPKTLLEISRSPNVCAVKEASGDLIQMSEIIGMMDQKFSVLSGDDMLLLPGLSLGARGVISVVANILPKETKDLISAYQAHKPEAALMIHKKMFPVMKAMFMETNPIPVKAAMAMLGWIQPEIRSPLTPLESDHMSSLKKVLLEFGLKV